MNAHLLNFYTLARIMKKYLSLVKFSHTIFALPFALVGYFLAVNEPNFGFDWKLLGLVILCMIFARNAAMSFNRYIDRNIDAKNPRTAIREIPAGILKANSVLIFIIVNSLLFIATTYFINSLCFYLSPVALLIVLGYSLTKRFTALCHVILGLGLSLAPIGAYLAVTGVFSIVPLLYGLAVLFWVAGFDIIYALQDLEFDMSQKLKSTPVWLGKRNALILSKMFHLLTALAMLYSAYLVGNLYPSLEFIHWLGVIIFISLLVYQHTLVKSNDLSKINLAFFTTNGVASIVFGSLFIADFYL